MLWIEGGDPREIVEARGMKQVTDLSAIEAVIDEVIAANPGKVSEVKAKPTMLGWFVGQVMKASGGKANPTAVNEILKGPAWARLRSHSSSKMSRMATGRSPQLRG